LSTGRDGGLCDFTKPASAATATCSIVATTTTTTTSDEEHRDARETARNGPGGRSLAEGDDAVGAVLCDRDASRVIHDLGTVVRSDRHRRCCGGGGNGDDESRDGGEQQRERDEQRDRSMNGHDASVTRPH
jgi:hypothetical protein